MKLDIHSHSELKSAYPGYCIANYYYQPTMDYGHITVSRIINIQLRLSTSRSNQLITSHRHLLTNQTSPYQPPTSAHNQPDSLYPNPAGPFPLAYEVKNLLSEFYHHLPSIIPASGSCASQEQETKDRVEIFHTCTKTGKRIFFRSSNHGTMYSEWWTKLAWSTTRGAVLTEDANSKIGGMYMYRVYAHHTPHWLAQRKWYKDHQPIDIKISTKTRSHESA